MSFGLAAARARYAAMLTQPIPCADPRLRAAFAAVPREAFAGKPPWTLLGAAFRPIPASDPAELYNDVLVVLDPVRRVNNGSPALHALMLHRLDVRPGDRVLHVGAGQGYYSALLAELAGPGGVVTAVEFDPALAQAARDNLRQWPSVSVVAGDGSALPTSEVDRIYVNFALADPADAWLDHLAPGGRLLFPLGSPRPGAEGAARLGSERAALLLVTRLAHGFAAAFDTPVSFVFAEGPTAGDPAMQAAVYQALGRDQLDAVRSLHRGPGPAGRTWFSSARWSLGLDPP